MCSQDKFALVTDFAWYTAILVELTNLPDNKKGKDIAQQLEEISLRVDTVRPFAVESMLSLLFNEKLVLGAARNTMFEVSICSSSYMPSIGFVKHMAPLSHDFCRY
jgi:AP-3 complex subunit delta-1